jgi:hypothetical protein
MLVTEHWCTIQDEVYVCTYPGNLGNQNGAQACIATSYGYSPACAGCLAGVGQCGYAHCWPSCFGVVDSKGCNDCLALNCDAAFMACSGITRPEAIDGGTDASCL